MKIGPHKGYYGRAFWCDKTECFIGWVICKERIMFTSKLEDKIAYNFRRAVNKYIKH